MKKLLYILALIIASVNVMAQQPLNQRGNTGEQWYESIVAESRPWLIAWKALDKPEINPNVRSNFVVIEKIAKYSKIYTGIDYSHTIRTLGKQLTEKELGDIISQINETEEPIKSIDHFRALMGAYEHISGVSPGRYINNSCEKTDVEWTLTSTQWDTTWNFDLPASGHITFTGEIKQVILPKGTKIYRVIGDGQNPAGKYWTYQPPQTKADLIGATAVKPSWNNHKWCVEYTVGDIELPVWEGPIAAQSILDGLDTQEYHLSGGGIQLYITEDARNHIMGGKEAMWKLAKPITLE